MTVQRDRMREILSELTRRRTSSPSSAAPGSPSRRTGSTAWPTSIFVGEAEETWPRFLEEWERAGTIQRRYEQAEKTDMTRVPMPRYDLLAVPQYAFGSVQISRGCPFQCEFCDIIVIFGRQPRIKTPAQVVAELERLLEQRHGDRLHRRRQLHRQQEGDQGHPPRRSPGRRRTATRWPSSPRRRSTWPRTTSCCG